MTKPCARSIYGPRRAETCPQLGYKWATVGVARCLWLLFYLVFRVESYQEKAETALRRSTRSEFDIAAFLQKIPQNINLYVVFLGVAN